MKDKLKEFVNTHRQEFDKQLPDPIVWERVAARVPTGAHKRRKAVPYRWYVAASIVLVLLISVQWIIQNAVGYREPLQMAEQSIAQPVVAGENSRPAEPLPNDIVSERQKMVSQGTVTKQGGSVSKASTSVSEDPKDALDSVHVVEHLVLSRLVDTLSAANRLSAILEIQELKIVQGAILGALEQVLTTDPNTNVRIAAWETLIAMTPESERLHKLQEVFVWQDDPIVQHELVQIMADVDGMAVSRQTVDRLLHLIEAPWATAALKENAYVVLLKNGKKNYCDAN